jgi:hypothetical protein
MNDDHLYRDLGCDSITINFKGLDRIPPPYEGGHNPQGHGGLAAIVVGPGHTKGQDAIGTFFLIRIRR